LRGARPLLAPAIVVSGRFEDSLPGRREEAPGVASLRSSTRNLLAGACEAAYESRWTSFDEV
jgi:hypothetical protein